MTNSKWYMTGPQLAGLVFGLFIVLAITLFSARSCSAPQQAVITVDTIFIDTTKRPEKPKKMRKERKLSPDKKPQPIQRNYRDEVVN